MAFLHGSLAVLLHRYDTDRCRYVGLVPFADDPEVAVEAGADVIGLQLADVDIGEYREAAENKKVADLFKPPGGERVAVCRTESWPDRR